MFSDTTMPRKKNRDCKKVSERQTLTARINQMNCYLQ